MLKVTNLSIRAKNGAKQTLLYPLSFSIAPGERLGVIGESGSGKTLTALAIMNLLDLDVSGDIELDGTAAMVFQEPMSALDPLMKIAKQLAYAGAEDFLTEVGLDPSMAQRYPHELSGGQRQRVLIAMAMAQRPQLLICDEPTTALDPATESEILNLIDDMCQKHGTALMFISHDLRVVSRMCQTIMVLKKGHHIETGTTLRDPYSIALYEASQPGPPALPSHTGEPIITLHNVGKYIADAVSLTIPRGARLGVIGASGSGKTTLLKLISGIEKPDTGTVEVNGKVQMIFQDPQGSLNPRLPVWKSVAEPIRASKADALAALKEVGIEDGDKYPHQFSGGQRQRISIARALIANPDILLADEAVSALDVTVRRQILDLLQRTVAQRGLTLVFVSHDLEVVRELCPDVAIIYQGSIIESGATETVWANPQHPYTQRLVAHTV